MRLTASSQLTIKALTVFLQHYRYAPLQASAILLGICLAVTLLIGVKATNQNAKQSYGEATELLSQRADFYITDKQKNGIDETVYFALKRAGISSLAVIEGFANDHQDRLWQITGSDVIAAINANKQAYADTQAKSDKQTAINFSQIPIADLLRGEPIALVSQQLYDKILNVVPMPFKLNGIEITLYPIDDNFGLGNKLLTDISLTQSLVSMHNRLSYVAVFMTEDTSLADLEHTLADAGIDLSQLHITMQDDGESLGALTDSFHLNLDAMSMLAFVVGLFIAYNGTRYSLMKRQSLFIQLLQMGIERRALFIALLIEISLLVVIGSLLGFIFGLQLSQWLQPMVAMTLEQIYGARLLPGHWQWQWFFEGLGLTLVAAVAACLPLLIQLTKVPLAQGAHRNISTGAYQTLFKRQAQIAVTLLLICAVLFSLTQNFRHSLLLLGVVTVAIPLLLPYTLSRGVNLLTPLMPKGIWQYAIAETKEMIAPLSLAMMAILLALCANIAMNTLVGSFENTLKKWLDARLHAELYIKPNPSQMPKLIDYLDNNSQISAVYQQWNMPSQIEINQRSIPINLVSRDLYSIKATSIMKTTMDELAWQQFARGQFALISEPVAIKYQVSVGDKLYIEALNQTLTIGGVYFDYGNPRGEVIISPTLWHNNNLSPYPISLAINYSGDIAEFEKTLLSELNLSSAFMYSQGRIKQEAIKMFTKTFSITVVLNSLTLLVAAIGLFSACLMMNQARLAPLARLYALGVNRGQLRLMVLTQMLVIVLLTSLLALPMGAFLGYLLIHKVTLQAFGWTIAMQWDWFAYFQVIVIAVLCCTSAVVLPLYWQTKKPLISSLQQETL